jgi:archaellum component FlaC
MTATASGNARNPGATIGALALTLAILWVAGSIAAAVALIGVDHLLSLKPVEMAALIAAAILPAFMAWFSGMAARDSARARAEAQRLADAADRLLNPEQSAEEAGRKLANTVRGEINQLDRALEQTLARLQEVEGQIARQAQTVDAMGAQAKAGANEMISGMEREREELMRISRDLSAQAQTIGDSISRHTQSISEAARQAEAEVRAADQALDHRLTSFGAAAALINDRTHGLSSAAQASADSALRLETALSNALDILAKATHLTDAARQSADAATVAANSTAGAVRDTTIRAIDDAKRAAELIRNEAVGVEREAAIALERLREAAEEARTAAIGAREAAEREARPQVRNRAQAAPSPQEDDGYYDTSWRNQSDPLSSAPPARGRREDAPMFGEREEPVRDYQRRDDDRAPSDWTWRELLSNVDNSAESQQRRAPAPQRREPAEDPVAHLRRQISEPRSPPSSLPIADVITQSGLRLDEVFSPSGLERIAQRSRGGTQARRRAVRDAAPEATRRLGDFLARNAAANQEAMQFLRSEGARTAELLGRGRAAMGAEATRAFLLIDAAAG